MRTIKFGSASLAIIALAFSLDATAVQVTVTDTCGGSLTGTGAVTAVDSAGNLSISGAAGPYQTLFGCDSQQPTVPSCSLSASKTSIAPGESTTLFARCSSNPTSFTWNAPSNTPSTPSAASSSITFPAAGAYTYSVSATNASGSGVTSNQVTILVADSSTFPLCTLTASPYQVLVGGSSRLQTTCNPAPTSYIWSADWGAPAAPTGASGDVTFPSAGIFTYKVRGTLAGAGPTAAATVTVLGPLSASESFSPATVAPGVASTLTITLTNSNATAATGVAFNSTYPTNLVNASPANGTTTCGGTVTATAGGTGLAVSGATVPASGNCTVSVDVSSSVAASYTHSTGPIGTSNMGTAAAAGAILSVASGPQYRSSVGYNGGTTVTNPTIAFPSTVSTDWLVMYVISLSAVPTPTGWSSVTSFGPWTGTYAYRSYVFARQVGNDANVSLSVNAGAVLIVAYQNVSGIGSVGFLWKVSTDTATTLAMNSITPQNANSVVLGIACDNDGSVNPVPPSDYTSRISFASSFFGNNISEKKYGNTSPTGNPTWTQSNASSHPAVGTLIELKP